MKKKLLAFIFAFSLIITGMIFLSACGKTTDTAQINNLYVQINGENNSYLGTFKYGQQLDFSKVKVMAKYSDNTEKELTNDTELISTYIYNNEVNKSFSELSITPDAGNYEVNFKYGDLKTSLTFRIEQTIYTDGYKISLDKQYWGYDETPADVSLINYPENTENSMSVYCITKQEYTNYNELETEDEKEDFLNNAKNYSNEIYSFDFGEYYAFAKVSETINYKEAFSNFVKFNINKGTLTKTEEANCEAQSYTYSDKIGKIKLKNIYLFYNWDNAQYVDKNGNKVEGNYSWVHPETEVGCSNSGSGYPVKFIPNSENWNTESYGSVNISVEKGKLDIPSETFESNIQYTSGMEQLSLFEIYNYPESYLNFINITKSINNGNFSECNTIVRNETAFIDNSVNSIGTYKYLISLKDTENYCWANDTSENLTYTFNVNKITPNIYEENDDYNRVIDSQGKIKVEIYTSDDCYTKGTMKATRLKYLYDYSEPTPSTVNCNFDILEENEKIYLIVTVTGFNNDDKYGNVGVKITATGKNNYEDIDYSFNLCINKYDPYDFMEECIKVFKEEHNLTETNHSIYKPVGTNVKDLFPQFPTNQYGHIVVEISTDGSENWSEVTDADIVTELYQKYVRFGFVSNNELYCGSEEDYFANYYIFSDYSKTKRTLSKDAITNYQSTEASGIWWFIDLSEETIGNRGYSVTLTATDTAISEIPTKFNIYYSDYDNIILIDKLPSATVDDFSPTGNENEYVLNFVTSNKYIYMYVEFPENVDVNISYSVTPKDY